MSDDTCIIDIGAIVGGNERHYLVEMLLAMFKQWAERQALPCEVLEKAPAFGGGLKWARLSISKVDRESLAALHAGVHTLVRTPPDDLNKRRHMSAAGVRVSGSPPPAVPESLPERLAGWGDERRRYVFDPEPVVVDTRLGRFKADLAMIFAGDFSALETRNSGNTE